MTFLQVLGLIFGIVVLFLLILLLAPVTVQMAFKEEFGFKASLFGVTVYKTTPKKPEKSQSKSDKTAESKEDNVAKGMWSRLKSKKGFFGAIKELMAFLKDCLSHIKPLLRYIKIRNINLSLVYGSGDAAETAIRYGEICTAVYPVLALLDTAKNIKFKHIDVKSEFTAQKAEFEFSLKISTQIFILLIMAVKIYGEYKKFLVRNEL